VSPDLARRAEELFIELADLPPEQRGPRLEEACAGNEALRDEVLSLLEALEEETGFLENPRVAPPAAGLDATLPAGTRIGAYTILGVLGSGGMGVVYLARQERPRRTVALKLIRRGLASPSMLRRFEHEAEVLGRLQHPGIAQIYEAGVAESASGGQPFIAMEFVRGRSLIDYARAHNLGTRERLELFARICDGVQHAHQRGVIHRDLKPANILVVDPTAEDKAAAAPPPPPSSPAAQPAGDTPPSGLRAADASDAERGQPKILDFGVARATDAELRHTTLHTSAGQIIGTLSYMSPEQVSGDTGDIDTRSDVYALGVILYELLAGRLPHDLSGRSLPEALRIIREDPPARLTTVSRTFRGDLETLVLKAIEKDRSRRYQSAADLGADVRRFLADEPIEAKRDSAMYVLRKQLRRYRSFVAAGVLAVLLLGVLAGYAAWQAAVNRRRALEETYAKQIAEKARDFAVAQRAEAETHRRRADDQAESLRRSLYFSRIGFAQAAFAGGEAGRMMRLLEECPSDLRGWEWDYLSRLVDGSSRSLQTQIHGHMFAARRPGPSGSTILVISQPSLQTRIWDEATGSMIAEALHPDPQYIFDVTADGTTALGAYHDPAVAPRLALYDTITLRRTVVPEINPSFSMGGVFSPAGAFSPDGRVVASGNRRGQVILWDAATGKIVRELERAPQPIASLCFAPDGATLAAGTDYGLLHVWDVATGATRYSLQAHQWMVGTVTFNPDGTLVASGGFDGAVQIRDASTGTLRIASRIHTNKVTALGFSPDGSLLASGSTDSLIHIIDPLTGELRRTLHGHADRVVMTAFTEDGSRLVSAGRDGTVKWWDNYLAPDVPVIPVPFGSPRAMAISRGGEIIVAGGESNAAAVWSVRERRMLRYLRGHTRPVHSIAINPADDSVATISFDRSVRYFDPYTGELHWAISDAHTGPGYNAAFSPDGRVLATVGNDDYARLWDTRTGGAITVLPGHGTAGLAVAFTPDGNHIVTGSQDGIVRFWKAATHECVAILPGHRGEVWNIITFRAPDGTQVALTGGEDHIVRLWDVGATAAGASAESACIRQFVGHRGGVFGLALHPGLARLATGSFDNTVRLWDLATGEEILSLKGHVLTVYSLAFTPDGRTLFSCGADRTIRVWESAPRR